MNRAEHIVSRALEHHVLLYVKEGRLAYKASGDGMPDDLREEIAAQKDEIIDYLRELALPAQADGWRLDHAPAGAVLPLSIQQQQVWMAQKIGAHGQYNIANGFEYHGTLDEDRLRQALRHVLQRQEILRTIYVEEGGEITQRVIDASGFDIVVRDMTDMTKAAGDGAMEALLTADQERPFDLAMDYPIRVTCYRRSPTDWVVSITIHHIASDGRSQELLVSEIAGAYQLLGERSVPRFDSLPYRYGDYAWSQRQALATGRLDREKAAWMRRLADVTTTASLPTDMTRPKVFVGSGGSVECRFSATETAHIVALARRRNVTLFMLLESMLALLVGRWSGSTDVVIGSPVAGRDDDGLQDVMGLFVNVLPLRSRCPDQGSLASFLDENKAMLVEAFAMKSLPLDVMLEALRIEPSRSHSPLFQTVFNLQPVMDAGFGLGGVAMSPLPQAPLIKYDLEVVALQGRNELSLSWKYADNLFSATTIEQLASSYRVLLSQAAANEDVDIGALSFGDIGIVDGPKAPVGEAAIADCGDEVRAILRSCFPGYLVEYVRLGSERTSRHVVYVLPMDDKEAETFVACRERAIADLTNALGTSAVPDAWQLVGHECLGVHGRIDHKAVPRVVLPLRSDTERRVAEIWNELLECGEVGLTEDFFDLGGNSIKAMRVTSKVSEAFGVQMQIRDLFERAVFADYAGQIEERLLEGLSTISKRPETERMSLSFAQERLWFLDQLNGGSPEYNMPALFRIEGNFDTALAEQAMGLIIERHEVLRTTYVDDGLGPVQHVTEPAAFHIDSADLSALPSATTDIELARLIRNEIARPFDLAAGPMVRAGYYRLHDTAEGQRQGILFFNIHHIACDGWSLDLLVNEFVTAYRALANAVEPALPVLPIQYGDYAYSQRQWLGSASFDRQLAYWLEQLDGVPAVHSLRLDTPRPAVKGYEGDCVAGSVDRATTDSFEALARRFQLTPFMLMHAALALVLARHGNADDVVIGTPVANRQKAQTEDLIGFFVSTLVLRVHTGHDGLEDYLRHVRQVHLDAQSNQDIPFELLVDRLGMPRTTQHTPLFQIMLTSDADFGLKRGDERALLTLPGANVRTFVFEGFAAKFDLEINISATRDGTAIRWTYDSGIFARATIERLNDHLERMMASLATMSIAEVAPAVPLRELSMLSPGELDFILRADTPIVAWPKDRCLHDLFLAQVERTPDAIALECDGERLSYRDLAARTTSMAGYLRQAYGVGPGQPVGICLERNIGMVVAMLGVLQAGGAYVPLDPAYPVARLVHIVTDAGIGVVLAQITTAGRIDGLACQRVLIDEPGFAPNSEAGTIDADASPDDLAYIIYTSGSTGTPKGVAIRHANAVAMLHWADSAYTDDELERVLASTSLSFDLSVFEIFVPLCFGHCCVLVRDALALVEHPVDVTLINTVPSAIKVLLESDAIPARTRTVNLAGEPLPRQVVNDLLSKGACLSVCNLYGPSEDTTYSTAARFDSPLDGSVPIGRVIANSQGFILSPSLALLPPGVVGELYLCGAGVAMGYYGNPELTASRFLDNPYHDPSNPNSGPVLYRTGDLVMYDTFGQLHFMGRGDSQVKLHGFRIELSEIEQQICRRTWVDSAVVLVHGPADGLRELVAYVRPTGTFAEGADRPLAFALREDLAQVLPSYMVPTNIVLIDAWPLSPNGKIDRAALPAPGEQGAAASARAPSGELEIRLLDIWESLLARTGFAVDADFFSLGGNSLLLTRLHSRIKAECGVGVSVRTLFGHRTIAAQALIIESFQTVRHAEEALAADVIEEEL